MKVRNDDSIHVSPLVSLDMERHKVHHGIDEEGIVLWINVSKASRSVGQASGKGHYKLSDHRVLPPEPIQDIDATVWRRFARKISSTEVTGLGDIWTWFLMIIFFAIFITGDVWEAQTEDDDNDNNNDQEYQVPLWFCVIFALSLIALFGRIFYISGQEQAKAAIDRQKIIDKMQRTTAMQGYSLSLIQTKNCTRCTESGIVIRPLTLEQMQNANLLLSKTADSKEENNLGESQAYIPQDWAPLEGMWVLKNRSRTIPSCIKVPISSIQVAATSGEETFTFVRSSQATICYGLCARDSEEDGKITGNTLVLGEVGEAFEANLLSMVPEEKRAQLQKIMDWARFDSTFCPLGLGRDGAYYYRNKTKGTVWRVLGATWKMFHDLEDDFFTDADILAGATFLSQETEGDDEQNWIEFERQSGLDGFQTVNLSSFARNYSSAKLVRLSSYVPYVCATQIAPSTLLITLGSCTWHDNLFGAVLLIATGVCAIVGCVCVFLLQCRINRAPLCNLVLSHISVTLHIVLYAGLAFRGMVNFDDGFIFLFSILFSFPASLLYMWFSRKWWSALHESTGADADGRYEANSLGMRYNTYTPLNIGEDADASSPSNIV